MQTRRLRSRGEWHHPIMVRVAALLVEARRRSRQVWIDARGVGRWAWHRAYQRDGFSVTFVPLGLNIDGAAAQLDARDAERIVRALGREDRFLDLRRGSGGGAVDGHIVEAIVAETMGEGR